MLVNLIHIFATTAGAIEQQEGLVVEIVTLMVRSSRLAFVDFIYIFFNKKSTDHAVHGGGGGGGGGGARGG